MKNILLKSLLLALVSSKVFAGGSQVGSAGKDGNILFTIANGTLVLEYKSGILSPPFLTLVKGPLGILLTAPATAPAEVDLATAMLNQLKTHLPQANKRIVNGPTKDTVVITNGTAKRLTAKQQEDLMAEVNQVLKPKAEELSLYFAQSIYINN